MDIVSKVFGMMLGVQKQYTYTSAAESRASDMYRAKEFERKVKSQHLRLKPAWDDAGAEEREDRRTNYFVSLTSTDHKNRIQTKSSTGKNVN